MKSKRTGILIVLMASMIIPMLAVWISADNERERIKNTVPIFNGNGLDYGSGIHGHIAYAALIAELLIIIAAITAVITSGRKLRGRLSAAAAVVFIGGINLFMTCLIAVSPDDGQSDNYYPEYYVVTDRDNTARLLFGEGMFLTDAHTDVYYLDADDRAYQIGSFSAKAMLRGGEYDIVRNGDTLTFSYDNGRREINTAVIKIPDVCR